MRMDYRKPPNTRPRSGGHTCVPMVQHFRGPGNRHLLARQSRSSHICFADACAYIAFLPGNSSTNQQSAAVGLQRGRNHGPARCQRHGKDFSCRNQFCAVRRTSFMRVSAGLFSADRTGGSASRVGWWQIPASSSYRRRGLHARAHHRSMLRCQPGEPLC